MNTFFEKITSAEQIEQLAALASTIWNEHFPPIIGQAQVDYMLDRFQSVPAITGQLRDGGYEYYFIVSDGSSVGYVGIRPDDGFLFLSKIYILREYRGRGLAKEAFRFLEKHCAERNLSFIRLTVNRENEGSIHAYEKMGFSIVSTLVADIGGGFVMDDYVMEKKV